MRARPRSLRASAARSGAAPLVPRRRRRRRQSPCWSASSAAASAGPSAAVDLPEGKPCSASLNCSAATSQPTCPTRHRPAAVRVAAEAPQRAPRASAPAIPSTGSSRAAAGLRTAAIVPGPTDPVDRAAVGARAAQRDLQRGDVAASLRRSGRAGRPSAATAASEHCDDLRTDEHDPCALRVTATADHAAATTLQKTGATSHRRARSAAPRLPAEAAHREHDARAPPR